MYINGKTNPGCIMKNCTCNDQIPRHKSKSAFRRRLRRSESIEWRRDNGL